MKKIFLAMCLMSSVAHASHFTIVETANNDPVQCSGAGWMYYPPYASPIVVETVCAPLEVQSSQTKKIYRIEKSFVCKDGEAAHYKFFNHAEAIAFLGCEKWVK